MAEKRRIYTVSELTRKIKVFLEGSFAQVWVEGEISNFKHHTSGHMYFSLKDESSVLNAVLFKNVNKDFKFELKDGIQVICFGRIGLYEPRGQYQLYVTKIEPKGIGALQLAFEQLKERLAKEGLFDEKRKQPVPYLPRTIGIVTSPTGAAIRDILHVLNRRFANLEIILNPVRVQGEGAAAEIARAIEEFNQFGKIDVLIVGRGGGSLEDLWAFNEEIVARAIFKSRIPVISAVGHEIDYTIADFVADLRAPTPSAAAELVIVHKQELIDKLEDFYYRATNAIVNQIAFLEDRLSRLKERYAFKQPSDLIQQYQQTIDNLCSNLDSQLKHLLEILQQKNIALSGKLQALSPLNILSRGYSITLCLPEEKAITDTQSLKAGTKVKTRIAQGEFISEVEEII
ncbi:MAG: exodeoxyribonuclease VII large subunit [Candidatus Omnitrophica bacterium]|nr:exodeoxyribonuclease VII large subunit [Candidatus Omnitrophota bacterium]